MFELLVKRTEDLSAAQLDEIRGMLTETFGARYDENAWQHCLGGTHYCLYYGRRLVSHASLVPRPLRQGDRVLDAVYGESMATVRPLQHSKLGTAVAALASAEVVLHHDLGAFGASRFGFYERLGWRCWTGPTYVMTADGPVPARPDRGAVMYLLPRDSDVDPNGELVADWRPGDVW